jgi:cell division protein FtsZ
VRELQEIDDFFDQLDPNIDVIWGTATDDSLGEDAKVTILATGLEDSMRNEVQTTNAYHDDDSFYEDLIPQLYKPVQKRKVVEVLTQELPFEVSPAEQPEPASVPDPQPVAEPAPVVAEPLAPSPEEPAAMPAEKAAAMSAEDTAKPKRSILDVWKDWLLSKMKEITDDC